MGELSLEQNTRCVAGTHERFCESIEKLTAVFWEQLDHAGVVFLWILMCFSSEPAFFSSSHQGPTCP